MRAMTAAASAMHATDALFERAVGLHTRGELNLAERCYRSILLDSPAHPDALHLLGVIAHQAGQNADAVKLIKRAIRSRPDVADYHSNLGDALHAERRPDEAAASYRVALALSPDHARIHNKLGAVLRDLGRTEQALHRFREAVRIDPGYAVALANLGATLRELSLFEEAAAVLQQVVAIIPGGATPRVNLANALFDLGRTDEAEECCRAALDIDRDDHSASYTLATTLLSTGRLDEAWPLFESRWHVGGHRPRDFGRPAWSPGRGRRVLFHSEQGFGDAIQFCRFVPRAAALAGGDRQAVLEVQAPLRRLIEEQGWPVSVVGRGEVQPAFDEQCAVMSLPWRLGVSLDEVWTAGPYLRADVARTAKWDARIAPLGGLRVGVAWAGSKDYPADRSRSIPRSALAPLAAVPGATFVSLQVGAASVDEGWNLHDWTDELEDFADTAALVAALDLVITVDTAVAHLAGALGKPVWLLNRFDSCWRWMRHRDDSPWYPTLRQFRQREAGEWGSVIARAADALAARSR